VRVVLDANVVVSAAMTAHGTCARLIDMLADGLFDICADDRILAEYDTVLHRPQLHIAAEDAGIVLELIRSIAEPVGAVPLPVKLPDANDAPFLEVAAAANAVLVTGNTRHYPKPSRAGVPVLTPKELLEIIRGSPLRAK
jgi:putative PIN family toxin of toxin-antitoxin system